jgi:hypothetical protein
VGLVSAALIYRAQDQETRSPQSEASGNSPESLLIGTPHDPYPSDWEVESLEAAERLATFTLIMPPDSLLRSQQITRVYVYPDNVAVAVDFAPQPQATATRQNYIEIWQASWSGGDPQKESLRQWNQRLVTMTGLLI